MEEDAARQGKMTEALSQARLTGALDMFRIVFNWAADDLKQPENLREIAADLDISVNLLISVALLLCLDRDCRADEPDTKPDEITALLVHHLPPRPPRAKKPIQGKVTSAQPPLSYRTT